MSARKWQFYTIDVGKEFVVEKPPKQLRTHIHAYGRDNGKRFSIVRVEPKKPEAGLVVKRIL